MKASLVIPTYNSREVLEHCLTSVTRQRLDPGDELEVVVADDGSDDGTAGLLRDLALPFPTRSLFLPRTESSCRSAARNRAIEAATGDVVVMTDGDQVLAPDFVAEHLRCHRHRPDLVVIGHRYYLADGPVDRDALSAGEVRAALPPVAEHDERDLILGELSENLAAVATRWHFLYGCNASVRRQHLLEAGGFDERIRRWSFEDVELGYRLWRRGLSFVHDRYAEVYHFVQHRSNADQYAAWRENFAYFTTKHPRLEVTLQGILDRHFDPVRGDLPWEECYLRFEYAVRALDGRRPTPESYELLRIGDENLDRARADLPALAAAQPLLIIDDTDDRDLPLLVQTLPTTRPPLYFKRPGAARLAEILCRHTVREPAT